MQTDGFEPNLKYENMTKKSSLTLLRVGST